MTIQVYCIAEWVDEVQALIDGEYRLNELVQVLNSNEQAPKTGQVFVVVNSKGVTIGLDWFDKRPPLLLQKNSSIEKEVLLALVYFLLENSSKAKDLLSGQPLLRQEIEVVDALKNGEPLETSVLTSGFDYFDEYRLMHNTAVLLQYGQELDEDIIKRVHYYYNEAIASAPEQELAAYSTKYYAIFLEQVGEIHRGIHLLEQYLTSGISEAANLSIKILLTGMVLTLPESAQDEQRRTQLQAWINEVLPILEGAGLPVELGMAYMDAAQVASWNGNHTEAIGCINKSIGLFEAEELDALKASAFYKKGIYLFLWSKSGMPQFFTSSAEAFHESLSFFTAEHTPSVYADIQQYLGLIYAEMPMEETKRGLWAAMSSSAFQESLKVYSESKAWYDYAKVCNAYGNALMRYPQAKLTDHFEKAAYYFNEALLIREPHLYPLERSITLLNYIEACWFIESESDFDTSRYDDMRAKATEVLALTNDEQLHMEAKRHLEQLEYLHKIASTD